LPRISISPGFSSQELLFFVRLAQGDSMTAALTEDTRMVEMVFPDQTNHYGTLFGGHALRLMDKSAFITASQYARRAMVTACSERVDFKAPVKHGQLVELLGRIVTVGKTSVTVEVDLFAEDLLSGIRSLCAKGRFVLVAVDESGQPVIIEPAGSK
jgi:acyl-CoA hydrolase